MPGRWNQSGSSERRRSSRCRSSGRAAKAAAACVTRRSATASGSAYNGRSAASRSGSHRSSRAANTSRRSAGRSASRSPAAGWSSEVVGTGPVWRSGHLRWVPAVLRETAPHTGQEPPMAQTQKTDPDDQADALGGARPVPRGSFRDRVRRKPGIGHAWRVGVFLLGLVCILGGFALAVLPGPLTIPPVLLGLWLWSTEFEWAHKFFRPF